MQHKTTTIYLPVTQINLAKKLGINISETTRRALEKEILRFKKVMR